MEVQGLNQCKTFTLSSENSNLKHCFTPSNQGEASLHSLQQNDATTPSFLSRVWDWILRIFCCCFDYDEKPKQQTPQKTPSTPVSEPPSFVQPRGQSKNIVSITLGSTLHHIEHKDGQFLNIDQLSDEVMQALATEIKKTPEKFPLKPEGMRWQFYEVRSKSKGPHPEVPLTQEFLSIINPFNRSEEELEIELHYTGDSSRNILCISAYDRAYKVHSIAEDAWIEYIFSNYWFDALSMNGRDTRSNRFQTRKIPEMAVWSVTRKQSQS